ncbi:uncharacterized protein B0I36DRAFT_392048 [Microdochium trichocladiopsis]|uniref:Uncharacterized protein n=1 Tax=Microdochium trichocladiopsis TaxID=1682393 RepID=A0A9P8YJ36_9PEZI|nr:uncharacterized protein B0I36DRAFT_392048 [Microdochium trichocladiopsis]KAH7041195.1 hypothetical protein B0I36DRAFT_392048 [Microdochium trichocladiopsis]
MTGLLFVTAQSTDVRDLNRILLYLRDWDITSAASSLSLAATTTTTTAVTHTSNNNSNKINNNINTTTVRQAKTTHAASRRTATVQDHQFLDRFRFVTRHSAETLVSQPASAAAAAAAAAAGTGVTTAQRHHVHGTFPPVPPSATLVNSWVGSGVDEIEAFMDTLADEVYSRDKELYHAAASNGLDGSSSNSNNNNNNNKNNNKYIGRRDSGYSSSDSTGGSDSDSSQASCYNTDMYLVVDEVGLATGTAILGCRRRGSVAGKGGSSSSSSSSSSWDRVRGVPWAEVCSVWKVVEKNKAVDSLVATQQQQQKEQKQIRSQPDSHGSKWLEYSKPIENGLLAPPRDCRRRDLEVSMWHECGLV